MDLERVEYGPPMVPLFRLFTKESIQRIEQAIREEAACADHQEQDEEDKPRPDPNFEVGKELPHRLHDAFPPELFGKPIEDLDPYYSNKYTFMVVGRDKNMYRFSATNSLFLLSPFNPVRRATIYTLTHPLFSMLVMLVILANCVFMAVNKEVKEAEIAFTLVYTVEGSVKILSRGFIIHPFTYLRDMWNWLDFTVVSFAYITMAVNLGNVGALRTFRVLRALKTVAVVPGLKTIVGALMEAVRRLRDVIVLSVFVLSIFALVGLQIYQGVLKQKCVLELPDVLQNKSYEIRLEWYEEKENWLMLESGDYIVCRNGTCPANYTCWQTGPNPNYGYTNFDNFGWAMLCAFRLMTQDYWENLYQLIIRAQGPFHVFFFVAVIFLGSFYLLNLILAIVAMSYDEQQKQDQEDAEDEEAEEEERRLMEQEALMQAHSSSDVSGDGDLLAVQNATGDRISIHSDFGLDKERRLSIVNHMGKKASLSLPGSPFPLRRGSRASQFSWKRKAYMARAGDKQPLVLPVLDNLNFPYADDSRAVTPSTEDLCNLHNTHSFVPHRRRLSSATSFKSNASHHQPHFEGVRFVPRSRRSSFTSDHSKYSDASKTGELISRTLMNRGEPTYFMWTASIKRPTTTVPDVVVDGTRSDENESSSSVTQLDTKAKLFADNPFIVRTPSVSGLDMQDVLILRDLVHASGRGSCMSDQPKLPRKEIIKERCMHLLFGWECSPCWHQFAHYVEIFIMDAFVDLFITLCILVNTAFMAGDHYDMNATFAEVLTQGNYVFTAIFTAEAVLKLIALSPFTYLKDKWNCFDITIVILSLVELGLSNVKGLSILRSFRLLRVFKLAKSWPTLNLLIGIIGRTMGALGNLCFVLLIIIFIFAVMGMQLFGKNYNEENFDGSVPRWNFTDFLHAFMIIFRVLCGEWIESMWDCMYSGNKYLCIPFFLLTMVIGNLVVLNLFLALLLSSFGAESLQQSQDESEPNKLQEAVERINRFVVYIKSKVNYCIKVRLRRFPKSFPDTRHMEDGGIPVRNGRIVENEIHSPLGTDGFPLRLYKGTTKSHVGYSPVSPYEVTEDHGMQTDQHSHSSESSSDSSPSGSLSESYASMYTSENADSYSRDETVSIDNRPIDGVEGPEINDVVVVFVKSPDECLPHSCTQKCGCCKAIDNTKVGTVWWTFRCYMYKLVEHKYFETFIIFMIIISSLALAAEDVNLPSRPYLQLALQIMDKCFTVIFVCEMLVKWFAFGFKKYFTDAWCWLDFVIVAVSLISLAADSIGLNEIGAFKALRTLRALRPLRAVSRWEGMKVVVNALIGAIPSIANVLLVCLVFWLIFAIMGVQLFNGRFGECVNAEGERLNASEIPNKDECDKHNVTRNYTWTSPKINFDNALNAYLALLQVATFKGWVPIMEDAVDSQGATFKGWTPIMEDAVDTVGEVEQQPVREKRELMYLYFVLFIVFGSFFTLNLFIGVIIDNFNMQKKKIRGSLEMFMTEDQKKYYNAMKKLGSKQPQKPIPKPKLKCQLFFFKVTTNQKFDIAIMLVIMMNMFVMALEHYDMDEDFKSAVNYINIVFIGIFTLECAMKLLGLRHYYFKQPWNVFDFVVVLFSLLALALDDMIKSYFVSPTLLRVVRVFRVGRVLRLVKSAKGIRTLLFSLAVSMPALFNIGLLLVLVMFIYAIFGMSFFLNVKHHEGVDDHLNFETFANSMIVLFMICTSSGWDSTLAGLMNEEDCDPGDKDKGIPSNCGNYKMAVLYLVTYLVVSFLVVINMYIAVILENFSQATEDVQQGLTQDDFDMYYEVWERFDEKATQYIPLEKMAEFVDTLEEPLRIPAPNLYKLISLDIVICEDDRVHCVDILDALTKNFLGTGGDAGPDGITGPSRKDYVPVSSLLKRQREIVCARVIQRTWKNYVHRRREQRRKQGEAITSIREEEEEGEEGGAASDSETAVELHADSQIVA